MHKQLLKISFILASIFSYTAVLAGSDFCPPASSITFEKATGSWENLWSPGWQYTLPEGWETVSSNLPSFAQGYPKIFLYKMGLDVNNDSINQFKVYCWYMMVGSSSSFISLKKSFTQDLQKTTEDFIKDNKWRRKDHFEYWPGLLGEGPSPSLICRVYPEEC